MKRLLINAGLLFSLFLPLLDQDARRSPDIRRLELGQVVERELAAGQSHSYQITLAADQYLHVVIEQRGVDVGVALLGPDGKKLAEANSAKGQQGIEVLTFIAEASGDYRLEVRTVEKNAVPGRYEVKVTAQRTPTAEERALEEARRSSEESRSFRQKGKYNEALPGAEHALAIREKVLGPEHPMVAESLHDLAILYDDKEDYAKAEPLNLRALAIREKS